MNEIIQVDQPAMLQALNVSEIDQQVATAHRYPRNVEHALSTIEKLATQDEETASDCFYMLHRTDKNGQDTTIEGLSVRMAEIIAGAWGNLRVASRIIGNDGKTITAQAVCHDLESNFAISVEVKRRITTKQGYTFSEDMQVVTGNAASAIARRNAILSVVPKAITNSVVKKIREIALGKAMDVPTTRQKLLATFAKMGVTTDQILHYLQIDNVEAIDKEQILQMRATFNAIKEGTTTVKETFIQPETEQKAANKVLEAADAAKKKAEAAMARSQRTGGSTARKAATPPTPPTSGTDNKAAK